MSMKAAIGFIMDNANAINRLCDENKASDSLRERCHRYHGELLVRGCTDPAEVMRVVASRLEREQRENEASPNA